ncbi:tail fiber domain-containing protein [Endozoicomonas sp. ONNA1]|uniref:tail fiber domain-containing protein n=1 Tax=Endozoicomonas sp. ONNA1 TaxID=2828740 RepID=UPI0021480B22|nr:tail fiber domain-containing protein [Endozoicomonas sp. ONNA1]
MAELKQGSTVAGHPIIHEGNFNRAWGGEYLEATISKDQWLPVAYTESETFYRSSISLEFAILGVNISVNGELLAEAMQTTNASRPMIIGRLFSHSADLINHNYQVQVMVEYRVTEDDDVGPVRSRGFRVSIRYIDGLVVGDTANIRVRLKNPINGVAWNLLAGIAPPMPTFTHDTVATLLRSGHTSTEGYLIQGSRFLRDGSNNLSDLSPFPGFFISGATDGGGMKYIGNSDADTNSKLTFITWDNSNEFFQWRHYPTGVSFLNDDTDPSIEDWMTLKRNELTVGDNTLLQDSTLSVTSHNNHTSRIHACGVLSGGQASGLLYAGQDLLYGVGLFYNGDDNNEFGDADHWYLHRRSDGVDYQLLSGFVNSNNISASGTITQGSDIRLKENIETITDAREVLLSWRGVSFIQKSDKSEMVGLIADEVEKTAPRLIQTDAKGYKSLAYSNTIAYVVEAYRELDGLLEDERKKVSALEESVETLQSQLVGALARIEALEAK